MNIQFSPNLRELSERKAISRKNGNRSGEEEVCLPRLGALDEGGHLVRGVDQRGTVRVGGLTDGDPAVGELHRLQAVPAVAATPRLVPALAAQLPRGHAVVDVRPHLDAIHSQLLAEI